MGTPACSAVSQLGTISWTNSAVSAWIMLLLLPGVVEVRRCVVRDWHVQLAAVRGCRGSRRRCPVSSPAGPRDDGPVGHLHRCCQPPGDAEQDPPLAGVV